MADKITPAERSQNMRQIRSKDTKPEMLVRRYLHAQGFRYRLHDKRLPGKPDIVLPRFKTAVVIQGCFWHKHGNGCGIRAKAPKSNLAYWEPKLERNVQRDRFTHAALREAGWQVLVIWECSLERSERGATLHRLSIDILDNEAGRVAA
ncbi:very short patch repair endonuclease [Hymenobacter cavernae]|uniref:Very short patch repair endonuclease n=1 Tax=Hymenobacter cavernae TaxID=2044852 RepID=A0ABQ1UYY7_9BACT|nr:very short patch repair endonuclease [Hymenobacter cavernae]GGF28794.1 very short patch repair endonuclease [Hymenobacter cavernae]